MQIVLFFWQPKLSQISAGQGNLGRFALTDSILVAEPYTPITIDFQNLDKELISFLEFISNFVDALVRYLRNV